MTDDAIAKALYGVKFRQIEENGRKFRHIELSNIVISVLYTSSEYPEILRDYILYIL